MRIVINAYSARIGGGQTYLLNLLANMPPDPDLDVHCFAPAALALPDDARIRRVHAAWPTTNPLLRALWEKVALPRYLAQVAADLLFCPGGVVATRAPAGCRTVTMFRNMIPFDPLARARVRGFLPRLRNVILHRVMLRSMREADMTIFISDHARAVIERLTTVGRAVTIAHGINAHFRTHGRALERPADAPEKAYVLYVSRIDAYKHHREVVEAFARLPASLRGSHVLVLAGEADSALAVELRQRIDELGVAGEVLLLGAVPYPALPPWYHHAKAILFASSCENCPNILLEALGSGAPVLSSDVMPMPEFGGKGIAYFSPFDPDDIADALSRVLSDPEHAHGVARAAVTRSGLYDWPQSARATWAALRDVAGTPRQVELTRGNSLQGKEMV